jgi:hypothetical protein
VLSLAEDLAALDQSHRVQCKTCKWLATLGAKERLAFQDFAGNRPPNISNASFHKTCLKNGLDAAVSSFVRHVNNHVSR